MVCTNNICVGESPTFGILAKHRTFVAIFNAPDHFRSAWRMARQYYLQLALRDAVDRRGRDLFVTRRGQPG
jgi:hypothetical protein